MREALPPSLLPCATIARSSGPMSFRVSAMKSVSMRCRLSCASFNAAGS
jgi:hypothetical protein